eukprot:TRINITY_DN12069_c0_g1_i1.p1 TRINITY_DN12069_c0_g1~~TRINITY_DN12069_c0_g1_i1.p1  ORF type:complete len:658 (+),score=145.61 TRINITY_DN12069_c0_g1_i1:193-1974(+)
MASPGGIGLRDHHDASILNSTELEWGLLNAAHYNVSTPVWQPDSHVGEANLYALLNRHRNIEVHLNEVILETNGVAKTDTRVTSISTQTNGTGPANVWHGNYFVDGSYEGDLIFQAGADMTFGREAKAKYNESYGGITDSSIAQFNVYVDPVWSNGTLLKFVSGNPDPHNHLGESDDNMMAYSFRACLTTRKDNQVPFPKPEGYSTADFELARRHVMAELEAKHSLRLPWGFLGYSNYPPGDKQDACCGSGPVGIDATGLEVGYANGTRAQRQAIYNRIKYYVQGLMYFWQQDPDANIPADTRTMFQSYGLCKDQWPENGHFPPQLYVREARRLVGDRVFTQNDRIEASSNCREDSIGLAVWGIDIHEMQRVAIPDNHNSSRLKAFNEGLTSPSMGGTFWYELPYWLLLPKRSQVINVMAPNTPSISHVAFASLRVEPTLWRLGQSSATAIFVAKNSNNAALHDVNITLVQELLLRQGVAIHYPFRPTCDSPTPAPPTPAPVGCHKFQVMGAGTATANGEYDYTKQDYGAPYFQGPNGFALYRYAGQWHIAVNSTIEYFCEGYNQPLPTLSGWEPKSGASPAPTLKCLDKEWL